MLNNAVLLYADVVDLWRISHNVWNEPKNATLVATLKSFAKNGGTIGFSYVIAVERTSASMIELSAPIILFYFI